MKIKYQNGDRSISINGQNVILPEPIWDVFEVDGRVVVFLDPYSSPRNVLCFNERGEQLWVVQDNGYFTQSGPEWYHALRRYGVHQDGPWEIYCRGRPFLIDLETGHVTFIPGSFER
jgi:hypothetical protein